MKSQAIEGEPWPLSEKAVEYIVRITGLSAFAARQALKDAMRKGEVDARGLKAGMKREPIEEEFWNYANLHEDGAAYSMTDFERFDWFEVRAADVLDYWPLLHSQAAHDVVAMTPPAPTTVFIEHPRTQGRRPYRMNEVMREMKTDIANGRVTAQELSDLTEELLARQYRANRETVRKSRRKILDELKATVPAIYRQKQQNSD